MGSRISFFAVIHHELEGGALLVVLCRSFLLVLVWLHVPFFQQYTDVLFFFRWIFLSFIGGFGSVTSASASVFSSFLWLFSCALSKFTVLIMY